MVTLNCPCKNEDRLTESIEALKSCGGLCGVSRHTRGLQIATGAVVEVLLSSNSCYVTEELRNSGIDSLVPVSAGVTMRALPSAPPMCDLRQLPTFPTVKANLIFNLVE